MTDKACSRACVRSFMTIHDQTTGSRSASRSGGGGTQLAHKVSLQTLRAHLASLHDRGLSIKLRDVDIQLKALGVASISLFGYTYLIVKCCNKKFFKLGPPELLRKYYMILIAYLNFPSIDNIYKLYLE